MNDIDYANMTKAEFEQHLPEFFAAGSGKVSTDSRLQLFLANNPDCAALVKDLETIAEYASSLFDPVEKDPSDHVWANIQAKLQDPLETPNPIADETGVPQGVKDGTRTESGPASLKGEPNQLPTGGSLHDIE